MGKGQTAGLFAESDQSINLTYNRSLPTFELAFFRMTETEQQRLEQVIGGLMEG